MTTHSTEKARPVAVLVNVHLAGVSQEENQSSVEELRRLVTTLGFEVITVISQRREKPAPGTVIGEGKLQELADWTGGTGEIRETEEGLPPAKSGRKADKVVFDCDLSPTQLRNITTATSAEVLDRTGVIVEIFHRHAKTREARAQVEIARLRYLTPRIRVVGPTDRQGGGIGSKGVGETAHELDRRRIRDRIAELQRELVAIHGDQKVRRSRRQDQARVALVGYTNAGKSSLMRALTGSGVLVEDKLFATLDTTVRAMHPETKPRVLISDTVGFIQKLPHDLVASFRSTLDEAKEASLLLLVVDASDVAFRRQMEVVREVLEEIGAGELPLTLVLNKIDQVDELHRKLLRKEFPGSIQMSALEANDVERLKQYIISHFQADMVEADFVIPYEASNLVGEIRRQATVVSETHDEESLIVRVRATPRMMERLQESLERMMESVSEEE